MESIELTPLERATGLVAGAQADSAPLPAHDGRSARATFEGALEALLRSGPCFVSFSGGRDSSAVLATAVHVARREGLAPPIPITLRFPGVASTVETEWQEQVIRHLGVGEWERIELTDELDFLGPMAQACLRRHGLLWPPNAHFHVPMFRLARRGCVLTGLDGDGLLGAWRWARAQAVLSRRVRPRPKDALTVGLALAPPWMRGRLRRHSRPPITWLRRAAAEEFDRLWARESAGEPRRWDRRLRWYAGRRYLFLAKRSLAALAADEGTQVAHPLSDPAFLAALSHEGGRFGWGDRTQTMAALFGDLLPRAVIERPRKAEFGRAFWRAEARSFAAAWDGTGVDAEIVDADKLREAWRADNPVFGSVTPLQIAWLHASNRRST